MTAQLPENGIDYSVSYHLVQVQSGQEAPAVGEQLPIMEVDDVGAGPGGDEGVAQDPAELDLQEGSVVSGKLELTNVSPASLLGEALS